jgi:transcriptional regulator with XRE-family HTH domain
MFPPSVSESWGRMSTVEVTAVGKRRGLATREGMETIAQRVMRLRKERGISQGEVAERLGLSQANVSDYERGVLRLHGELIIKLAEILDVSTDELLGRAPQPRTNGAPKNRRILRRLQQLDRLPERDQQAILRTLDVFLKARAQ